MLTVLGARKLLRLEVCLQNTTMRFIMVVLQPSYCAPLSVFQAIMGKELRLQQGKFGILLEELSVPSRKDEVR